MSNNTIPSSGATPPEEVQFKKLDPDALIPTRATQYSAGFDLYALKDTHIDPVAGNTLVPTGIAVQLPEGTYGRIAMRSGLAVKQHLVVSAGVIDIDYTGPIGVVVGCTKVVNVKWVAVPHEYYSAPNISPTPALGYTIKKGKGLLSS